MAAPPQSRLGVALVLAVQFSLCSVRRRRVAIKSESLARLASSNARQSVFGADATTTTAAAACDRDHGCAPDRPITPSSSPTPDQS